MSNKRLKILVFSDWFLPGFRAGGPIRSLANLVIALDRCDFYIVTRITDHHSTTPYPGKKSREWYTFNNHTQVMYLAEDDIRPSVLKPLISDPTFDRIYINSLFSPKFALLPLWLVQKLGVSEKVIVSPRGMLKKGALSMKPVKKKLFLKAARWVGFYKGVLWEATNAQEAMEIGEHFGSKIRYRIAPNLASVPVKRAVKMKKKTGELMLVCVARISPEKGIFEALDFLRVARLKGKVSIKFYGAKTNRTYLHMCEAVAETIPDVSVTFCGEVDPSALPGILAENHFMFMPTLGENYGHAIVEALVNATPVIISDRTPWRELQEHRAGWDLPLKAEAFAPVLKECLEMDHEAYIQLSNGAYTFGTASANDPETIQAAYALFESPE
jgi:glycosyltransferase involved in cell wall biosynthesis